MAQASKTQIDRLGDRLRKSAFEKPDLILLDSYRRSFNPAYETVVQTIRDTIKLEPSGRPAKSTNSLIEKLKRESIRLTQVQDVAGCRVVVGEILEQERVVAGLAEIFPGASLIDRRVKPSYGYRAVHIVVEVSGKTVEIQVRTTFQHIWAEISEKYADLYGSEIKYGRGAKRIRGILDRMSVLIAKFEELEKEASQLPESQEVRKLREAMREIRRNVAELLDNEISWLDIRKEKKR